MEQEFAVVGISHPRYGGNLGHVVAYYPEIKTSKMAKKVVKRFGSNEIKDVKIVFLSRDDIKRRNETPSGFASSLMKAGVIDRLCMDQIRPAYVQESLEFGDGIMIAVANRKSGMPKILGFVTIKLVDMTKDNEEVSGYFDVLNHAKPHGIKVIKTNPIKKVAYVNVLCSAYNAGGKLLDLLENPPRLLTNLLKSEYDAVALKSTVDAYTYYASRGYLRTKDMKTIYPIIGSMHNPDQHNLERFRRGTYETRKAVILHLTQKEVDDDLYTYMKLVPNEKHKAFLARYHISRIAQSVVQDAVRK